MSAVAFMAKTMGLMSKGIISAIGALPWKYLFYHVSVMKKIFFSWNTKPIYGCWLVVFVVGLWSSMVSAAPAAMPAPADWLSRMVSAPSSLDYQGQFIYENASGLMTIQIFHSGANGRENERLIYLDGPYRELIRKGDQVAYIRPSGDVSRFRPEQAVAMVERVGVWRDDLRRSYRLLFGGDDRVANRSVMRIEVQPRDQHRYGYTLWLDKDTGLLLRSEMLGEKGLCWSGFSSSASMLAIKYRIRLLNHPDRSLGKPRKSLLRVIS